MAAYICLNCEEIAKLTEDEPCCDAPDLITMNDMPAEIKRLRAALIATASGPRMKEAIAIARGEEALRWSGRVNGLQARLREVEERYLTLLKAVADGVATQPRPPIILNGPELAAVGSWPEPAAWVVECDEVGSEGQPLRARDIDWDQTLLDQLPVGTKLFVRQSPNTEREEAACYRWLRANWGQLATHTSYGDIGAPHVVSSITLVRTLRPVDPDSLHRAILRAMSEGEKAC
jgi:hypothetical protein